MFCSPRAILPTLVSSAPLSRSDRFLAAVDAAGARFDEALVDEFLQHAAEGLLGDAQDIQKFGDGQARIAADEMQHAVVRPAVGISYVVVNGEVAFEEGVHQGAHPGRVLLAGSASR